MSDTSTKVYFVTTGLKEEIQVIRKVRPPRLLCSYWFFKTKPLRDFVGSLGYSPEIMLDSGAYTAFTKGRSVCLFDYIRYIEENAEYISRYVSLDVIGDSFSTKAYFEIMRHKGLHPIPVFHYGDEPYLMAYYEARGDGEIALGNSVGTRDKKAVAEWCKSIHRQYPAVKLHLLGSSSKKILDCGAVDSCDSSAWYTMAVNGKPKTMPGRTSAAKIARAEENMVRIMEVFNEISVPAVDHCGECADSEIQPVCPF